jgi:hypothetical protein
MIIDGLTQREDTHTPDPVPRGHSKSATPHTVEHEEEIDH